MSIELYDLGDLVRCSAAFTNSAGTALDPTAVIVKVKAPDGTVTTYTYGTDPEVVRDSAGNYHIDVDADASGTWYYRFHATGTGQSADEAAFFIQPSSVVSG